MAEVQTEPEVGRVRANHLAHPDAELDGTEQRALLHRPIKLLERDPNAEAGGVVADLLERVGQAAQRRFNVVVGRRRRVGTVE